MVRIAHISDIHYYNSFYISPLRLLNKRLTGYLNLIFNRRFYHNPHLLSIMMEAIGKCRVDYLVVTGDLTNLSLGSEMAGVREVLETAGLGSEKIVVVPGNHDYYTAGAVKSGRFEAYFSANMKSDVEWGGDCYPLVRWVDGIMFIGIRTAVANPVFVARGVVGIEQLTRLEILFSGMEVEKFFPVFCLHHPPFRHHRGYLHPVEGLKDYKKFLSVVPFKRALLLHGHLHRTQFRVIRNADKLLWIGCVSSSSSIYAGREGRMISSFMVYDIDCRARKILNMRWFRFNSKTKSYLDAGLDASSAVGQGF